MWLICQCSWYFFVAMLNDDVGCFVKKDNYKLSWSINLVWYDYNENHDILVFMFQTDQA